MNTGTDIYDDFIAQWKADGHIAVVRHHCEQCHLSTATESECKTLQYAFPEGNIAIMRERVANGPWDCHRNVAQIEKGEMFQEEIHR